MPAPAPAPRGSAPTTGVPRSRRPPAPSESSPDSSEASESEESEEESEDEDEEPVKVRKFEHDGTTYLLDENTNILYDVESQDEVGIWNPETKSIDEIEDDEE